MSQYKLQTSFTMALVLVLAALNGDSVQAGPKYDPTRQELESVLADLEAWLPGDWDSFPQIHLERTLRVPVGGEHEHWYRSFARIDAPQVGPVVFYGQINVGGRDGPLLPRSQILYTAVIDEQRGVVNINGQSPADPEKFENLHRHPELWKEVRMRDAAATKCDFLWRRSGTQVVGVLDGKTDERRVKGPGTCTYTTEGGQEFSSDAEWVLSPDELWLYDINTLQGLQFIGRPDRTHTRLYRVRDYRCTVQDRDGARTLDAYDRGYRMELMELGGRTTPLWLLRGWYPDKEGHGLQDRLRLLREEAPSLASAVVAADGEPGTRLIEWRGEGASVQCRLVGPAGSAAAAGAARN